MSGTIRIGSQISVSPPTPELVQWTAQNLVIDNPEYVKRQRLGLWVGRTPKYISLYEIHGDSIVFPYGTLKQVLNVLKDQNYSTVLEFEHPAQVDYGGTDVPLYDYQESAVHWTMKAGMGILQSAAGSGKTQMGIAIAKKYGRRALWLTHTIDLLNQSRDRALQYIDPEVIGQISEGQVNLGSGITFATIQTMSKLDLTPLRNYWDVIICDECHRISGSPTTVTQFYKILNNLAARHKFGLSATVHRSDGMIVETFSLLGDIAYTVPEEAVKDKIMQVSIQPIETETSESREYLGYDGMLSYAKLLTYLCNDADRNAQIIDLLCQNEENSCLILSDRVSHLAELETLLPIRLREYGVLIDGKTKKDVREQAIADMRTGKKRFLFATYSLAKEGLDIPILSRLLLTTPHKDSAVITQSIGRIARVHADKPEPICYDFVDSKIRYLYKAYKSRCTIYRKDKCNFLK